MDIRHRHLMAMLGTVLLLTASFASALDEHYFTETTAAVSTTSTAWQDGATVSFTSTGGDYLVLATAEVGDSTTTYNALAQLTIDGTTWGAYDAEPKAVANYQTFVTHKVVTLAAGIHTFKLQFCSENAAATATLRNARIVVWALLSHLTDADQDDQVDVTTTETAVASLACTAAAGDYLIIATAEQRPNSTSYSIQTSLKVDGTVQDTDLREGKDTTDYYSFGAIRKVALADGTHTFTLTAKSERGTMYIRRPRITAIPLAGITNWYAESESQSATTSTTLQTKTTLTFTPSAARDILILNTGRIQASTVVYSTNTCVTLDAIAQSAGVLVPQDTTDYATTALAKVVNLPASEHTVTAAYASSSSAGTARLKNCRLLAIALDGPQSGPFSLANGYFSIAGTNGMITSLRHDPTGVGAYGSNTIGSGTDAHFAFVVDDVLMTDPGATAEVDGNTLTIRGLPQGNTLALTLSGNALTAALAFSGTHAVKHEWDLVWLDNGFYQRATGQNFSPDQAVDMPFATFYHTYNGNHRCVEQFKRTGNDYTTSDLRGVFWWNTHCRGRVGGDVKLTGSLPLRLFETTETELTLSQQDTAAGAAQVIVYSLPRTTNMTIDYNRAMPEFYVSPDPAIASLHDASVIHSGSQLLTELFEQMTLWWGGSNTGWFNDSGQAGGVWSDWSAIAGCFMDTPFRDETQNNCASWGIGDDGYGHYGWVPTTWPFPDSTFDTRHFDTNAIFINSLARLCSWTGDTAWLTAADGNDRSIRIHYADDTLHVPAASVACTQCMLGSTYGQTFVASKNFVQVSAEVATYGSANSSCTLSLYDGVGGTLLASQAFANIPDNSLLTLTFAAKPAGAYYLEISEVSDPAVSPLGWWGDTSNVYADGKPYVNRVGPGSLMDKARDAMAYQQNTLLGATYNQAVLGTQIGSDDHCGRHDQDANSNYYDLLPFGYHDAMTDITYTESLRSMAELEQLLGNTTAAAAWRARFDAARTMFNDTYWRTGRDRRGVDARYIGCIDVNGADHDYGYTFINTMALCARLAENYPARVSSIFNWLDTGESFHGQYAREGRKKIIYQDGSVTYNPAGDTPAYAYQLTSGNTLDERFFAPKPFTSVGMNNPTWNTATSGFTMSLLDGATGAVLASQVFTNCVDNAYNLMSFAAKPAGCYILRMSNPVGTIGWWKGEWSADLYGRWLFAPRSSTIANTDWWCVGMWSGMPEPTAPDYWYRFDIQIQNGGADLYESGFDIWARAKYGDPDAAWDRLLWLLRRYADPDRLSGTQGFYGEEIQSNTRGAGAVGWAYSEFPETAVLGAAFFRGFFGIAEGASGISFQPRIPAGHGITTVGARNISFRGALFNLEGTATTLRFICTRNPGNKTFYFTGGQSCSGTFDYTCPLDGAGKAAISDAAP